MLIGFRRLWCTVLEFFNAIDIDQHARLWDATPLHFLPISMSWIGHWFQDTPCRNDIPCCGMSPTWHRLAELLTNDSRIFSLNCGGSFARGTASQRVSLIIFRSDNRNMNGRAQCGATNHHWCDLDGGYSARQSVTEQDRNHCNTPWDDLSSEHERVSRSVSLFVENLMRVTTSYAKIRCLQLGQRYDLRCCNRTLIFLF